MTPVSRQPVTAGTGVVDPAGTPTASTLADTVRMLEAELATLQAIPGTILSTHDVEQVLLSINERLLSTLEAEIAGALLIDGDELVMKSCVGHQSEATARLRMRRGEGLAGLVFQTGEPQQVDDCVHDRRISRDVTALAVEEQVRSALAVPLRVRGQMTGVLEVWRRRPSVFTGEDSRRMHALASLAAIAIDNAHLYGAQSAALRELADARSDLDAQVGLLRQSQAMQSAEIFAAVSDEVGRLFGGHCAVVRFEPKGPAIVFVGVGKTLEGLPVGTRWELDDSMASAEVYRTGRPARVDAMDWSSASEPVAEAGERLGVVSTVASPIVVEGRRWGAVTVGSMDKPLPLGSEERLEKFTELVAAAIANAESRASLGQLVEEQTALRRVATLVAEGAPPTTVFDAVAAEMEGLLGADRVSLSRYEPGAEITVLAHRGSGAELVPSGSRLSHEGDNVQEMVRRTERPARMENFEEAHGRIAEVQRTMGVRVVVAAPVVVDGRVWGVIGASWVSEESPPADTEERMAKFAGLLETAIANADSRDQLTASRARLVTEGDEARRRVVRDLHDGAQARLVHTIVALKLARQALEQNDGEAESLVGEALDQLERGNAELHELAHGILPADLTRGGLRAGVDAVVTRLNLPVQVDVPAERFAEEIEASAYFVVAEALTNVVKHSHARHAEVKAFVDDGMLHVVVRDNGLGGADPEGHGLVGMADRVTALGGRLDVESPADGGTLLAATLPVSPSR